MLGNAHLHNGNNSFGCGIINLVLYFNQNLEVFGGLQCHFGPNKGTSKYFPLYHTTKGKKPLYHVLHATLTQQI
jgi:hypothetical protein